MAVYLIWRVALAPVLLLAIATLSFILMNAVTGGVESGLIHGLGLEPTPETIASVRAQFGLDRPLYVQFLEWLGAALRFDFGRSFITGNSVGDELKLFLPNTLELAAVSLGIAILVGLPLGLWTAVRAGSGIDLLVRILAVCGTAFPTFWLAYFLAYIFAVHLSWFPLMGQGSVEHIVLPAITLASAHIAVFARLLRNSALEQLREPYIRFARARGIPNRLLIARHVLRNAIIPVLGMVGVAAGGMLGGAVIVETVFAWPGLGRYFIQSVLVRDLPVVQAYICIVAALVVTANLAMDLVHAWIDPRVAARSVSH